MMDVLFMKGLQLLLGVVQTVFDVLFFWLPVDPLRPLIQDWDLVSAANVQAIKWLNWFVDVGFFSTVFGLFVGVFLAFAAWKVIMVIVDWVYRGVESVPLVE